MTKKFFLKTSPIILLLGILLLTACRNSTPNQEPINIPMGPALTALPQIWQVPPPPEHATIAEELISRELPQLTPLIPGELLVTMHTSMGDIVFRFFPTEAPLAVENFITHAWNGYYNGVSFHRVMPDFMVQGGCPEGTGMAGESIWGQTFGQELSPQLRHFRGALAMAQTRMPNSIGSQFYVVQNTDIGGMYRSEFARMLQTQDEQLYEFPDGSTMTIGEMFPAASLDYFIENGGTPFLDWHFSENPHTVFGHVVAGMDVVDAIVGVETEGGGEANPFQHRPVRPVLINGFSFNEYAG